MKLRLVFWAVFLNNVKYIPSLDFTGLDIENIGQSDTPHVDLIIGFMEIRMVQTIPLLLPLLMTLIRTRQLF